MIYLTTLSIAQIFFFGATAPIWALAYLRETLRFTSASERAKTVHALDLSATVTGIAQITEC
jgi:hypothetical protein